MPNTELRAIRQDLRTFANHRDSSDPVDAAEKTIMKHNIKQIDRLILANSKKNTNPARSTGAVIFNFAMTIVHMLVCGYVIVTAVSLASPTLVHTFLRHGVSLSKAELLESFAYWLITPAVNLSVLQAYITFLCTALLGMTLARGNLLLYALLAVLSMWWPDQLQMVDSRVVDLMEDLGFVPDRLVMEAQ